MELNDHRSFCLCASLCELWLVSWECTRFQNNKKMHWSWWIHFSPSFHLYSTAICINYSDSVIVFQFCIRYGIYHNHFNQVYFNYKLLLQTDQQCIFQSSLLVLIILINIVSSVTEIKLQETRIFFFSVFIIGNTVVWKVEKARKSSELWA